MIRGAELRRLARPDSAEFGWDPACACVIAGDDARLAAALEKRLSARGWRVVRVSSAEVVEAGTEAIVARVGRVGAWLSVAPRASFQPTASVSESLLGDVVEETWLAQQFRTAKALSSQLNAPGAPRTWFVAVTRLDGRLGFAPGPAPTSVLSSGVFGLVKTLRLEWPAVFCRAIDVDPGLDDAFAAERIVEELHDPDMTRGEVGHHAGGRVAIGLHEDVDV